MAIRPVITWGDPRLKMNSIDVGEWTPELEQLTADMFETMYAEEGVGLAAPQVAQNINLVVIDVSAGEDPSQKLVLINPEILRGEGTQVGQEGCLSVPGIHEIVERPQHVWIKNRRRDGSWEELEVQDLLARAFCHEIDHLRGKLFVEYFGPVKRGLIQRKYQKLQASKK